jgi:DNA-binding helix-hairpin-helix protein with protein kinase domain
MPEPTVYDSHGRPLRLGAEIGKGGEGTVFEVAGSADRVAKLYRAPTSEQGAKLGAMLGLQSSSLLKVAAWPVETLHGKGGVLRGFLMPRASGQPIHILYGPKSRITHFPRATWPFLLQAAANLARAFAVVHERGLVVGDVNHGNSLVSEQATVALIDCDSFQVPNGSRPFYCGVGVETHVPPELQGRDLRHLPRTPNHDAFGLAVLIFQILFMGRHPFSGRFLGTGDMPIPKAIQEFRFAYGLDAAARQMQPPPNTLPRTALSTEVSGLFERAFSPRGITGERPTAQEWAAGLESFGRQLRICDQSPAHHYFRDLPACPWCEIESRSGVLLFALWLATPAPGMEAPGTFQLALVWAKIAAVPHPKPTPLLPDPGSLRPPASFAARREGRRRRWWIAAAIFLGLTGSGLSFLAKEAAPFLILFSLAIARLIASIGGRPLHQRTLFERRLVQAEFSKLTNAWRTEASTAAFLNKRRDLERLRATHADLPAARQRGLVKLQENLRQRQLERFLDQFRIERTKIRHIGPSRQATLQSYGIETAADIDPIVITRIPTFGPAMAQVLLTWRQEIERHFVFDPSRGLDPEDLRALDRSLATQKAQIERELKAGPLHLEQLRRSIELRRQRLLPQLTLLAGRIAQIEADLKAL